VICHDGLSSEEVKHLECGHVFHAGVWICTVYLLDKCRKNIYCIFWTIGRSGLYRPQGLFIGLVQIIRG
jgi:hypothetical protein